MNEPMRLPDREGWWVREEDGVPVRIVVGPLTKKLQLMINPHHMVTPAPGRWLPVLLPTFPPLKPLHRCEGVECVVKCVVKCGDEVLLATRFPDLLYLHVHWSKHPISYLLTNATQLTRAECEDAGFAWPENAKEPEVKG